MSAKLPFKYTGAVVLGSVRLLNISANGTQRNDHSFPSLLIIWNRISAEHLLLSSTLLHSQWLPILARRLFITSSLPSSSSWPVSIRFSRSHSTWVLLFSYVAMTIRHLFFDRQRFYRYNEQRIQRQEEEKNASNSNPNARRSPPYWKIFQKCFPQCFNVFFVFFVTLSIFPTIHSGIRWRM